MRARLLPVLFLLITASATAGPPPDTLEVVRVPIDISIWRGISIGEAVRGGDESRVVENNLMIALPIGEAYRLRGIAVGIGGTAYNTDVRGVQVGGLGNVAGSDVRGIQASGLANVAGIDLRGIQAAGLANVAGNDVRGIQAAGLANIAGKDVRGIQASGLVGIAGGSMRGIQLSGLVSTTGGGGLGIQAAGLASVSGDGVAGLQLGGLATIAGAGFSGLQTAGLVSIVGEKFAGLQFAGLLSISGGATSGIQTAGLIAIASRVEGLQLAPVNIAGSSRGVQLGVVNIAGGRHGIPVGLYSRVENVPVNLEVWLDETAALLVSVRSGSRRITNYFGIGARSFAESAARWDAHAGLGVQGNLTGDWGWAVEAFAHALFAENFRGHPNGLFRLRVPFDYTFSPRVTVFAGPTLTVHVSDRNASDGLFPTPLFNPSDAVRGWAGGVAGLRVRISEG